ncbi:hypothetical protein [Thermococcus sp.]
MEESPERWKGGREKPYARNSERLLLDILNEGVLWAALGRPHEVMPFLRGKLLSNGFSMRTKREIEWILDQLERYYEYVAGIGKVDEKHLMAVKSFYRDIVAVISFEKA